MVLSPLTDAEGKPAEAARDRLAMFLTNIVHDTVPRGPKRIGAGQVNQNPPLHLDIYFMLASGHDPKVYGEGLKMISAALTFLQAYPVMTPQNTPDMPAGLTQLSIEIGNLRVEELGQLWGNLGGRYAPSVLFKMRSVMIDAGAISAVVPRVSDPSSGTVPRPERVS